MRQEDVYTLTPERMAHYELVEPKYHFVIINGDTKEVVEDLSLTYYQYANSRASVLSYENQGVHYIVKRLMDMEPVLPTEPVENVEYFPPAEGTI